MTPTTTSSNTDARPKAWQQSLVELFKQEQVRQVAYVPDAGHARLIQAAQQDPDIHDTALTTEEEGIALAAGAWLGGQRCVLLMQSSGVGNCVNMLSLMSSCQFPLLMLVTMRGEYAEFNPWQNPMGSTTRQALELMGVKVHRVTEEDDVRETVEAAFIEAFETGARVAVLLSQKLIGRKKWEGAQ